MPKGAPPPACLTMTVSVDYIMRLYVKRILIRSDTTNHFILIAIAFISFHFPFEIYENHFFAFSLFFPSHYVLVLFCFGPFLNFPFCIAMRNDKHLLAIEIDARFIICGTVVEHAKDKCKCSSK